MARIKFTAPRIESFTCPAGKSQAFLWDDAAPGLALRATAAGAKAYVFQSRFDGAPIRVTIGDPASWSIPAARTEARRLQTLIDQGKDPREEKAASIAKEQANRQAAAAKRARESLLVEEAWVAYLAARQPKWSPRTYLDHVRLSAAGGKERKRGTGVTVAGPLAPLMRLRLVELTAERLEAWAVEEGATRPSNTAHAFRLVRGFIRWCADQPEYRGVVDAEAYRSKAVAEAVPSTRAKEGDSLQREQLKPWFDAVRRIPNRVISAYLQGLLITGARREELAGLQWEDVDFQWRTLIIKDKVDGMRVVPLTPYLAGLLDALPRANEWVFSSARLVADPRTGEAGWVNVSESGHIAEPRIAHTKALSAVGLPHVSLHGLRRSFGTLCEWIEMPSGISAQIMGHKPSALAEKHYRRRPVDLLRMWHEKIEAWMLEQAAVLRVRAEVQAAGVGIPAPG